MTTTTRTWTVAWRGTETVVESERFSPYAAAVTLTDLTVSAAGVDGPSADDLAPGETTTLVVEASHGGKPVTLRYRVTAR